MAESFFRHANRWIVAYVLMAGGAVIASAALIGFALFLVQIRAESIATTQAFAERADLLVALHESARNLDDETLSRPALGEELASLDLRLDRLRAAPELPGEVDSRDRDLAAITTARQAVGRHWAAAFKALAHGT